MWRLNRYSIKNAQFTLPHHPSNFPPTPSFPALKHETAQIAVKWSSEQRHDFFNRIFKLSCPTPSPLRPQALRKVHMTTKWNTQIKFLFHPLPAAIYHLTNSNVRKNRKNFLPVSFLCDPRHFPHFVKQAGESEKGKKDTTKNPLSQSENSSIPHILALFIASNVMLMEERPYKSGDGSRKFALVRTTSSLVNFFILHHSKSHTQELLEKFSPPHSMNLFLSISDFLTLSSRHCC